MDAHPKIAPLFMESAVFFPMTDTGGVSDTSGSAAAEARPQVERWLKANGVL